MKSGQSVASVWLRDVDGRDALLAAIRGITSCGYAITGSRRSDDKSVEVTLAVPAGLRFADVLKNLEAAGVKAD
ncbi:MAG TPA: hypothetical protein VF998_05585 [Candidatus Limnocylindria bacterium]